MKRWSLLTLIIVAAGMGYGIYKLGAQPGTAEWQFRWTPPTTGSPVVIYEVERNLNDEIYMVGAVPDTFISIPILTGSTRVRVRGVDDLGRRGPWSLWSEVALDYGPPGNPGQPVWQVIVR